MLVKSSERDKVIETTQATAIKLNFREVKQQQAEDVTKKDTVSRDYYTARMREKQQNMYLNSKNQQSWSNRGSTVKTKANFLK